MKKIIGIIVIILMIPIIISVIGDIDRTPVYPTTEFNIIDKPSNKQLLSNDKLLYQLPNTTNITINELPLYVEYYEYGILEVDSGILDYTVNDNLAYINYIEGELTQVVDGELIISKPTQIISKSSNLFDKNDSIVPDYVITSIGSIDRIDGDFYQDKFITIKPNQNYIIVKNGVASSGTLSFYDSNFNHIGRMGSPVINVNDIVILSPPNATYAKFRGTLNAIDSLQLNEGTTALPYQPFAEHIYNLDNGVELYKLPNGVGDIWYQDGTLERNVGVIDTVNNYAEYGTLPQGTYENILEFINDNQKKDVKIYYNDIIQGHRFNTYLENGSILLSNDTEFITIYEDDTYTSTLNLDTDITYKLEGYNILEYIDGEFDNTVLAFFWIIPVLLVGGLIYLLLKRKE